MAVRTGRLLGLRYSKARRDWKTMVSTSCWVTAIVARMAAICPTRSRVLSSSSRPRRAASAACSFCSTPASWLTKISAEAYITHSPGLESSTSAGSDASQLITGATAPRKSSGIPLPSARRSARAPHRRR